MINRKWVKLLDLSKLDLYPLQFANCDRLSKNEAVYIFDEVGSGKTISSGIMALDYLECNPDKNVLIITTNSLSRCGFSAPDGQFKKDLFDKLPFQILGFENRVSVINNHHANFKKDKKIGLLIIDEAQLFLNSETNRSQNLKRYVNADKIVFLSATPIKTNFMDLHEYVNIAEKIIGKKLDRTWIDNIKTIGKEWTQIICSQFNTDLPVTRYFKDTIMSLKSKEGFVKSQAKRLTPQLWEYNGRTDKDNCIIQHIIKIQSSSPKSRFVIFTRFVEKEAYRLKQVFENAGYVHFIADKCSITNRTYSVVTGQNANELSLFSGTSNIPDILILTYQIAEQGINLPGYDHVVNYHISAFPSALEQRFGRIDRMGKNGSIYTEINMCYLLSKNNFDSSTTNFYRAVSTCLYSLLSYMPSKNTLIDDKIIDNYFQKRVLVNDYIKKIEALCNDDAEVNRAFEYYKERYNEYTNRVNSEFYVEFVEQGIEHGGELVEFCESVDIDYDFATNTFLDIQDNLVKDIENRLTNLKQDFASGTKISEKGFKHLLDSIKDQVFYCKSEFWTNADWENLDFKNTITCVDAISQCGKEIADNDKYKLYYNLFMNEVKLPLLFEKEKPLLNSIFIRLFTSNDFNRLFPTNGYRELLTHDIKIFDSHPEKELILNNIDNLILALPFFKMCSAYRKALHESCINQAGYYYRRYDDNPFTMSMYRVANLDIYISAEFKNAYFKPMSYPEYRYFARKFFVIDLKENKGNQVGVASNWLKLTYHYCKAEEKMVGNASLFLEYLITDSGRLRSVFNTWLYNNCPSPEYVFSNDIWTKGVLHVLYPRRW